MPVSAGLGAEASRRPTGGDKPYLISGADDKTVKLWDYQARTCVQTLSDHTHNVSAVAFHPDLPIILTGAEDGAVRIFHIGGEQGNSPLDPAVT